MNRFATFSLIWLFAIGIHGIAQSAQVGSLSSGTLSAARITEIKSMIAGSRPFPAPVISDRVAWDRLAKNPMFVSRVKAAEGLLKSPVPPLSDDLYLEFSRNGNRSNWQDIEFARRARLTPLVIAECVENKGRFLPAIEDLITTLCGERTWVLPAHDKTLTNFKGELITIDLASSAMAWNLAVADRLLGPKLSDRVRAELRKAVGLRVLAPFQDMIRQKRKPDHWLTTTNNWNAVCLAGVIGAGVIELDSAEVKAELIAAAELYSENFLAGFTGDGYCSEGLGYWNYGFGHYALLSETIRSVTNGKLDLLARPSARMPAAFGARIGIAHGVAPAFADCSLRAQPSGHLMWLLNRKFAFGLPDYGDAAIQQPASTLFETMIYGIVAADSPILPAVSVSSPADAFRTWFDEAGILICRPGNSRNPLAAAFKGGHNAEHHNHNDLGSYVVMCGTEALLVDPGNETYTARTFSSRRYESKLLNSFGHPVPVVAGKLQRSGRKAEAKILETHFSESQDTLSLDITSAYDCTELKRLIRRFEYDRATSGVIRVTDQAEFSSPQTFETALITLAKWSLDEDGRGLTMSGEHESLRVAIDTHGAPCEIAAEEIRENSPTKPTRIGIKLTQPVAAATVTLTIRQCTTCPPIPKKDRK